MLRSRIVGLYSSNCYKTLTGAVLNGSAATVARPIEDRFAGSHGRIVPGVVSRHCSGQGGDIKDSPDVKRLLDDIYKDFDEKKKDDIPESKNDVNDSDKDLKQLLSELYDDPDKESGTVSGYTEFKDSDATIIYDVDEERELRRKIEEDGVQAPTSPSQKQVLHNKYDDITNTHGDRGAFSLAELVSVLEREKLRDVAVIEVPEDRNYVDHLVIATARSNQHIRVTATLVRKLYKLKMFEDEVIPRIEGLGENNGWMAIDLGNIALHVFNQAEREYYDLETLWLVGPRYDDNCGEEGLDALEKLMAVPQDRLVEFVPLSKEHNDDKNTPTEIIEHKKLFIKS